MNRAFIVYAILFPVLILAQVLICNHIMLFDVAVPFIFIYFIIRLPIGMSKNMLFTLAFLTGFFIDILSDTPGVNSLASLILALLKSPVYYAYIPRDDKTKHLIPCIANLGWEYYSKFMGTMTLIYCFLTFSIEYFNFAGIKEILIMTAGSTLLTFLLLYGIDSLVNIERRACVP